MGSVATINKCYRDVCCPKDFKIPNDNQRENSSINEDDNKIISNPSINCNESLNNKNENIFAFDHDDEYNIYNRDEKIEAHDYENGNIDNLNFFDNNFKNDIDLINDDNNFFESSHKSGFNSLNFSFKYLAKNSLKENDENNNKIKKFKNKTISKDDNKDNNFNSNYDISLIIKIQRRFRQYINRKKVSEKKPESNDNGKKKIKKLNLINAKSSKICSSLLLHRFLIDIDFIKVSEESFRSLTVKSTKLQEIEPPQFCTLRDLDNDQIKGYFLLKKKKFKFQGRKDKEGKKIGFGLIFWEDSSKLKGYFTNSKLNGIAYFQNCGNDNSTFFGEYKNNIPIGYGIYSRKGYILEGNNWEKNNLNDIGISIWEEGEMYEGEFKNSTKDGIGLYRWVDGTSYVGQFKKNKIHGYGKMTFSNGNSYEGEFNEGFLTGWGKFVWDDGKYYIGNYLKDKKHGFGFFVWSLEPLIALIGFWNQGKQSGICIKLFKGECKIVFANESKNIIEIRNKYEISKYLLPYQIKYKHFFKKKYNEYVKFINFASK